MRCSTVWTSSHAHLQLLGYGRSDKHSSLKLKSVSCTEKQTFLIFYPFYTVNSDSLSLSILTLGILTLSITLSVSIMTLGILTLSTTLSLTILSKKDLIVTPSIMEFSKMTHSIVSLFAALRIMSLSIECCYAECRGALRTSYLLINSTKCVKSD